MTSLHFDVFSRSFLYILMFSKHLHHIRVHLHPRVLFLVADRRSSLICVPQTSPFFGSLFSTNHHVHFYLLKNRRVCPHVCPFHISFQPCIAWLHSIDHLFSSPSCSFSNSHTNTLTSISIYNWKFYPLYLSILSPLPIIFDILHFSSFIPPPSSLKIGPRYWKLCVTSTLSSPMFTLSRSSSSPCTTITIMDHSEHNEHNEHNET